MSLIVFRVTRHIISSFWSLLLSVLFSFSFSLPGLDSDPGALSGPSPPLPTTVALCWGYWAMLSKYCEHNLVKKFGVAKALLWRGGRRVDEREEVE